MPIRRLALADHARVLDLWKRAGLHTIRPTGRDAPDAFAAQLAQRGTCLLGLEDEDGSLLGVVLATHDGRKGWINRLAVDPSCRRQAHGRALVAAAERHLENEGIRVIAALVEEDNASSLAFFQAAGYRLGREVRYLSKRGSSDD